MLQGLYAAASGMEAQQNQFNAIANDMANIDTPGYQATRMGFEDLLYSSAGSASGSPNIATGAGSASTIVGRSMTQGAIQNTGRSLDVAIQGPGYLQVRRDDGSTGLTRNGALQVNAQGEITNQEGNPLVPPLKLPKGTNRRQHQDRIQRPGHRRHADHRQDRAGQRPGPGSASARRQQHVQRHRGQRRHPSGRRPLRFSRARSKAPTSTWPRT